MNLKLKTSVASTVSQLAPVYESNDSLTNAIEDADRLAGNLALSPEEALKLDNKMYKKYPALFDDVRPENDFIK